MEHGGTLYFPDLPRSSQCELDKTFWDSRPMFDCAWIFDHTPPLPRHLCMRTGFVPRLRVWHRQQTDADQTCQNLSFNVLQVPWCGAKHYRILSWYSSGSWLTTIIFQNCSLSTISKELVCEHEVPAAGQEADTPELRVSRCEHQGISEPCTVLPWMDHTSHCEIRGSSVVMFCSNTERYWK